MSSNNILKYSSLTQEEKSRLGFFSEVDDKEDEDLVALYESGRLSGWAGPEEAKIAWEQLRRTDNFYENIGDYISAEGTDKMMLYEITRKLLGKDTENYNQQIGDCYVSGTAVTMADGSEKNIEDIEIGESVLNHLNQPRKVIDLVRKNYTGDMVTIKLKGWDRKLTATATHDALYLPQTTVRFKDNGIAKKKFGDYQIGDYLYLPYGLQSNEYQYVEYKGKKIKVDENFARFIGLYLAEGGLSYDKDKKTSRRIQFSFNINEELYAEEIIALSESLFDAKATKNYNMKEKHVLIVNICNTKLVTFIKNLIPGNVYTKEVPKVFFSSPKTVKISLMRGWLDGDGHESKDMNRINGVSASKKLINDMCSISLSCKINPMSCTNKKAPHQRVAATRMNIYGEQSSELGYKQSRIVRKNRNNHTDNGFVRRIRSVEKEAVVDFPVFCVTVEEEHTLIANGIAQKNCVSFGMKNAIEYLQAVEIFLKGDREIWKPVYPPFLYGTGRVFSGGGRIPCFSDGSLGAWMADAVMKYGVLFSDTEGVPAYSGSQAKKWGCRPGPDQKFLDIAKAYPVKSAAAINTWEEMKAAIVNGYPVTVASNQGFAMEASSDGFHHVRGSWGHQLCCLPTTLVKSLQPKEISKIKVGEKVMAKDGKLHKVTEVFTRPFKGEVTVIRAYGSNEMKLTDNHPVLVVRDIDDTIDTCHEINLIEGNLSQLTIDKKSVKIWVNASDVKIGDFLVSPALKLDEQESIIPEWVDIKGKSKKVIKLEDTEDIAWLFGLYLADGSSEKGHKIKITLGKHEVETVERACKVLIKIGLKPTLKYKDNFVRVVAYSAVLADSFKLWFDMKDNKHIPDWLWTWKNLKYVVDGLFDGDGCYVQKAGMQRISNTSKTLIDQVQTILTLQGNPSSVYINKPNKIKYPTWKDVHIIDWNPLGHRLNYNKWEGNDLLLKVRETKKEFYEGDVYNLEVEDDHSYIVENAVVHNCIIGVGSKPVDYCIILNSWGNSHGQLLDFDDPSIKLPIGCIRALRSEIESSMIKDGEVYAISGFEGFKQQKLDRNKFNVL